jgi:hypothetical protein
VKPHWLAGDFDYNGFVDDDDVTLLGVFYEPAGPLGQAPPANLISVVAWSPAAAVAWSPDRATPATAGLHSLRAETETFGQDHVRGPETRAQQGTRAQQWPGAQQRGTVNSDWLHIGAELVDLVIESIAVEFESRRFLSADLSLRPLRRAARV